ncbi:MAG: ABC transporter substrate-binding protein [Alphaproteobacteria bacterium]|nr:ABC transporter substrate-binding protein [Alphaproteobacteria bacterium]
MIKGVIQLSLLFVLFFSNTAIAETELFGLAMHGEAKYNAESDHLSYANPHAPKGGDIKIAAIGTFDTLNPYSIKGQAPENMNLVYDRLMQRAWDEPFTMYPLIAEKVTMPEDRSSITFHVNPAAQFHDGSKVTADDVIFSYETLRDHGRPNMRNIYKLVEVAEKIDDLTVKFSFNTNYDRETVMIMALMPVLSQAWWEDKDFDATLTEPPLTNGPYRIKESNVGKNIIYERVEDYWAIDLLVNKGHYNFKAITYEYFRDDTIALEALKKGDLDIRREWDIGKWQSAYDGLPDYLVKSEISHQRPERAHAFIFNMRRDIFKKLEVRKALSLAFDEEWVGQNIFHGQSKRIKSYFPNSALDGSETLQEGFYDDHNQDLRTRLRAADALLKEAGWHIEDSKRVEIKSGKPLAFELLVSTPQEEKIALAYQKPLQRLGVDMSIRMMDSATFQQRKNEYDYDMISFFWQNSLSPGTEQSVYWSCAAMNQVARFNYSGFCDEEIDEIIGRLPHAETYDILVKYAQTIDRNLISEYVAVPLFYNGVDYIVHKKNIKRPDKTALYGAVMETWWKEE